MQEKQEARLIRRLKLKKIDPAELSITRVPWGQGFGYRDAGGEPLADLAIRERIQTLVIPPAWQEVRIAAEEGAHLQAIGRDDAGRLQYIYHPQWEHVRAARKVERLRSLGVALPNVRRALAKELRRRSLGRSTILAAAATLVDRAAIRAGHEAYAGEEGGRGAATLLKRHATVADGHVHVAFPGKGGRLVTRSVADGRLSAIIGMLKEVPGPRLFKERNGRSERLMTAEDLNAFLRELAQADVTAKDFRTFHGSARALELLCSAGEPATARERKHILASVSRDVAELLQNTPAVARSSYVHASILDAFEEGGLKAALIGSRPRAGLTRAETALMRFLEEATES